jgi:hypothetical protein
MTIVIAACSNRKTKTPAGRLRGDGIPRGSLEEVAAAWSDRAARAKRKFRAAELYAGRSFLLSRDAAAFLDGKLYIASAGLAVIGSDERVPAYDLTVSRSLSSNILGRITDAPAAGPAEWWEALCRHSRYGSSVREVISSSPRHLVLLALPATYLAMAAQDLESLSDRGLARLRIFTRATPHSLSEKVRGCVMPYEDRLDGPDSPLPGTRSDYAARALWHFATNVLKRAPTGSLPTHARMVRGTISRWRKEKISRRQRRSDEELLTLIREHWTTTGGSKTGFLRLLRDEMNVACEQGRLSRLVSEAKREAPK